jgi:serine/threonine protein kinase
VTDHNEGILEFGRLPETGDWDRNWLWTCRGQLKVIVTDFRVGVHYATEPHHFVPIIDHLEQLHANHYVHGDIRAYNMVLKYNQSRTTKNDECEGWLIDFDFGGKITDETGNHPKYNPKYPLGYVTVLADGSRQGERGNNISYADDWYALGRVIFFCHSLSLVGIRDFELRDFKDNFLAENGVYTSPSVAQSLRDFLILTSQKGATLELSRGFEKSLQDTI